ncbi:ATP-binding cassette domain-containing protein [Cryptosporangium minutisporangium]|uniref:ABC transporter ATP-binding protein n=1 Tax=Cryptosporangium minutisporangium TaxID=113569 RepID=A0ABP6ST01_9ACTN
MADPILDVQGLRKVFRSRSGLRHEEFLAVDDVSFTVPAGGSLAIVGESGSGKTTCARIVAGLATATSGTVRLDGQSVAGTSLRDRRRRASCVQMVFQDPYQSLDRRQTVAQCLAEVVAHHTDLDRAGRKARIDELLGLVGLDPTHGRSLPRALSGGQRQRVAIARALAANPRLLVLDEAVAALDVSIQAQVLNLLADARAATGVAYLFITHDLSVVRHVCDDVVVMSRGRVVETGPVERVLDAPADAYTQRLVGSIPRPGWVPQRRGGDRAS